MTKSSSLLAQIKVSSTNFRAQDMPSTILSYLPSSDDALSPMGTVRYLNLPCGSRNVVMYELFGSKASGKYPCTSSCLAKHVAKLAMACKILAVHGNG